jgi:hypothetical protein
MTSAEVESTTIENAKAIGELTTIAKQTSKDVDRLITHLNAMPTSRIVSIEDRLNEVEETHKRFMASSTITWIIGGIVAIAIVFSGYLESNIKKCYDNIASIANKVLVVEQQAKGNRHTIDRHEKLIRDISKRK